MTFDVVSFAIGFQLVLKYFFVFCATVFLGLWFLGYSGKILKSIYGFVDDGEVLKYSLLATCLGIIVAVYWSFRVTKEAIFFDLVGKEYLPVAKMTTPLVLFVVLYFLGFVVDRIKKHRLFAIVCLSYGFVFSIIALMIKINFPAIESAIFAFIPGRGIGWLFFWAVESLGGVIIGAVFWAFVSSTTKTESAKRGFPFVTLMAQVGFLLGPSFVVAFSVQLGNPNIILIMSALLMLVPLIIEFYMKVVPSHLHESDDAGTKKRKTGAWEGLRLIVTKPFLMGILVVSTVYEIVGTIIDYQFKVNALSVYVKEEYAAFMGICAVCSALIGISLALGGTSFFIRRLGVRFSLLLYPAVMGVVIFSVWLWPSLMGFFVAMMLVKALSYAVNNPVKELLYLPTSKDVKMKAKGFIDGFGGKSAKSFGSIINSFIGKDMLMLLNVGSLISIVIILFWIVVGLAVGTKYDSLIKKNEILE